MSSTSRAPSRADEPAGVTVRFYAQLLDLVDDATLEVPLGMPRSVKDLIEACGVPHPEVALAVVDGHPVGPDHLLRGAERVAVYPPLRNLAPPRPAWAPTPPNPPRFVADVHLGTLARRLRLLGLDTWYATDADDRTLADRAQADQRILLSRDRGLLMRRAIVFGYCPRSQDPDEQLEEVVDRYDLGQHTAPGSRCPRCNGELDPVAAQDVAAVVPPRTRDAFDTYRQCRRCARVYWPGAHRRAIDAIVARVTGSET